MILPANLLFFASLEDVDMMDFFSFLPTLGFLGWVLWRLDVAIPPLQVVLYILLIANALVFLYLATVASAVSRYQLPLATYDFVYAAVYMGMSVTVAVFFLLGYIVVSPVLGLSLASGDLLNLFLLGMAVSLFFMWVVPRLKDGTDRILAQTYLRKHIGPRSRLKELAEQICTISSESEIFDTTAREIAGAMRFRQLGIFVRGEFSEEFALRAEVGWGGDGYTRRTLEGRSQLVQLLAGRQAPLIYDGSEIEVRAEVLAAIEDTRKTLGPERQKRTLDVYLRQRAVRVLSEGTTVTGVVTQRGEVFGSRVLIDATEATIGRHRPTRIGVHRVPAAAATTRRRTSKPRR